MTISASDAAATLQPLALPDTALQNAKPLRLLLALPAGRLRALASVRYAAASWRLGSGIEQPGHAPQPVGSEPTESVKRYA